MQKKRSCSDNVGPHYLQMYVTKLSSYTYRTVYWAPLNGHFLVEVLAGHQNGLKGHTETLVKVLAYMYICIYIYKQLKHYLLTLSV